MANNDTDNMEMVLAELTAIKRLLTLALLRDGARQTDVAAAMKCSQATISNMFPTKIKIKSNT